MVLFLLASSLFAQQARGGHLPAGEEVTIWFFDVGQGDAILIDAGEDQMLIDGGGNLSVMEKLGAVLPPWDDTIEYVVNTHPHADHLVGLVDVLENYSVEHILVSGEEFSSAVTHAFSEASTLDQIITKQGDSYQLGSNITLNILWPEASLEGEYLSDPNDGSIVVQLNHGEIQMVFMGDAGLAQENEMRSVLGDVDVLKVGHHGSRTSTGSSFLDIIDPEVAVISAGEGNSYGHPHEIILDRLERHGIETLRTDLHGDIRIVSDGEKIEIKLFEL